MCFSVVKSKYVLFLADTLKKNSPFAFLSTYEAFKSREGIICRINLAERFKIGYF